MDVSGHERLADQLTRPFLVSLQSVNYD